MAGRMHADEVDTDVALVRRLLAGQFPAWAGLAVERVESAGTVNAVYRLGEEMAVRLPRIAGGAKDVELEQRLLPRLAPALPVAVPEPIGLGGPAEGYPWPWSVYRWRECTPGRSPKAALLSVVSNVRAVAAAVAAMIRSWAPPGFPSRRTWASRRAWITAT